MREELSKSALPSIVDFVGTRLSLACAVHCATTPILIILLPTFAFGFMNEPAHRWVILISIGLSFASFCWGISRHGDWRLFFLVGSGVALLIRSLCNTGGHHAMLTAIGGLCLAIAHVVNRRLCQKCTHCDEVHIEMDT